MNLTCLNESVAITASLMLFNTAANHLGFSLNVSQFYDGKELSPIAVCNSLSTNGFLIIPKDSLRIYPEVQLF